MRKRVLPFFALLLIMTFTGCTQNTPTSGSDSHISFNVNSSNSEHNDNSSSSVNGSTNSGENDDITSDVQTNSDVPTVYMTSDISTQGMLAVYNALGWQPAGKVAVKLSMGEPPASNYLCPELIKDLVQSVDGTIVECNTAYRLPCEEFEENNYNLRFRHCKILL